jgi:hypothetical protein
MTGRERLAMIMRAQAVAFAVYGLGLFLIPEFLLDTLFGWENAELFWARAIGAPFVGITLLEWNIAARLDTRMDLVWPFVVIPGLFVIGFLWSEFADELERADGHEAFFWLGFGISAFFFVVVAWARAVAER